MQSSWEQILHSAEIISFTHCFTGSTMKGDSTLPFSGLPFHFTLCSVTSIILLFLLSLSYSVAPAQDSYSSYTCQEPISFLVLTLETF